MCRLFHFYTIALFMLFLLSTCDGKAVLSGRIDEPKMAMDKITEINTGAGLTNLYEGDIALTKDDIEMVDMSEEGDIDGQDVKDMRKRNAERQRKKLWHNRVVPYEISSELSSNPEAIYSAFDEYHEKTCLQFIPRTTENNWVKFVKEKGCWSSIGRSYWSSISQDVSLGSGCMHKGVIIHELMHALGFFHEQSRPDRNKFVEVFWENIKEGESHNFNKYSHRTLDVLAVNYDYESIMHYGTKAFSKNEKATIQVIGNPSATIGQRDGLSNTDVIKINALYNCHINGSGWSEWSSYSPCTNECVKTRQRYCFSYDLVDCPGVSEYGVQTEETKCSNEECFVPVQGHWGRWSLWATCNATCGIGSKKRTRQCDDPPPKHDGDDCQGNKEESAQCVLGSCTLGPDDCEFGAGDSCHWVPNSSNTDYVWKVHNGLTPSGATGPNGDYTTGSGYYMYTEASYPAMPGMKALLTSKVFRSHCRCMNWAYNMYGQGIGELSVYVQPLGGQRRTLWYRSGEQGQQWITDEVTITNVSTTNYTVQFESVRGNHYTGDIAVDDIHFKEQPCGVKPLGCYKDEQEARALPEFLVSFRRNIDWDNLQAIVNECACFAFERGYKFFSVQFYGECWGSQSQDYDQYGPGECSDGVGHEWSNFVYTFGN